MPRDYRVDDGFGAQGLDYNKPLARFEGYSVKSGCKVTINSGDLGSGNNTLSVASGTVIAGGSTVSISSQSVDIPASDSDPRKDLVVYDESDAAITVKGGTAEAAVPANATGRDARRPAPQDLFAEDAVVLCEVWVPGGASSVGSGDLTDRRLFATQPAVVTEQLNGASLVHPDGSNDATKLQDAIDNRDGTEPVVYFARESGDSEWDKKVTLPADEPEFALSTVGIPTLKPVTGFASNFAFERASATGAADDNRRIFIDRFSIDDQNDQLTQAMHLRDMQFSTVYIPHTNKCAALKTNAANITFARNLLFGGYHNRGSQGDEVIHLVDDSSGGGNQSRENMIINAFGNTTDATNPLFRDECKGNIWFGTHSGGMPSGITIYQFEQTGYRLIESNTDDITNPKYIVKEVDNGRASKPSGEIYLHGDQGVQKFAKSRILSPKTQFYYSGDPSDNAFGGVSDYFAPLKVSTLQQGLPSTVNDASTGTGIDFHIFNEAPAYRFRTGSSSGNTAELNLGGGFLQPKAFPWKLLLRVFINDTTNVVYRIGLRADSDNFCELIFDPGDTITDGGGSSLPSQTNWNFYLRTGATDRSVTDTGTAPSSSTPQTFALQRVDTGTTANWVAAIDESEVADAGNGGTPIGRSEPRVYAETKEAASKRIELECKRSGLRCLVP